jgi:hypothetical protein
MQSDTTVTRQHFQRRTIEFDGWLRSDGLWDFEARLADRKPFPSWGMTGNQRAAEEHYHHMWVKLTTDKSLVIVAVETSMLAHPFPTCLGGQASFSSLVGVRLGRGWRKAVMERLGGVAACNHMMELILPLPSMVIQTVGYGTHYPNMTPQQIRDRIIGGKMAPVDSCHAWRDGGPVAREFAPHRYND